MWVDILRDAEVGTRIMEYSHRKAEAPILRYMLTHHAPRAR